jgi:hypothetical protein
MPTKQTQPPTDQQTRALYSALAYASGRPEDWFAPLLGMPWTDDTLAMLREEREPETDRERKALDMYRRSIRRLGGDDLLTL